MKMNANETFCYSCPEAHYFEHTRLYAVELPVVSWHHLF